MTWTFNAPLKTLADPEENTHAKGVWEGENLGGIKEDNNRLPKPVVGLLLLTIVTAFLITAPLWGQRPQASIYAEYVALMDTPEVQAIADDKGKMDYIVSTVRAKGSEWEGLQNRHPLDMDDLRLIKDEIIELQNAGEDLSEYTVVGDHVYLANFEGNWKEDGSRRTRIQPWWDKGYTIDVFYVTYFCLAVMITVKRLPESTWIPDHSKHH